MEQTIFITLPGFQYQYGNTDNNIANNFNLNLKIINLLKQYPYKFYPGLQIQSVYDNFPCVWGGGRALENRGNIQESEINNSLIPFLKQGVQIRYNFTNCLLTKKYLSDENSNYILYHSIKLAQQYNSKIGIVIYSDLLKNYLTNLYKDNIEFIYSTTLGKLSLNEINQKTQDNILVLDYNYNNNFSFLTQLQYPENIEILANEHCLPNCPYRELHFKMYSAVQLKRINIQKNKLPEIGCSNSSFTSSNIQNLQVSTKNFIDNYLPLGINKLKIVGRLSQKDELISEYLQWLVLPQYYKEIKEILYNE